MEQFNDKKNSMETVEEIPLIDILYKDTYRIDSYLAQLLNGTLRSIKEQETTLQGASLSGKLDLKFLQAESNGKGSAGNLIEHDIDPHDRNVLSFLEILDLSPVRALPPGADGMLVHLQGNLCVRNYKILGELVQAAEKNKGVLPVPANNIKRISSYFNVLKSIVPFDIEMEFSLPSGDTVHGMMKEDCLLTDYRSLLATYGRALPGLWNVIGILDVKPPSHETEGESIRSILDTFVSIVDKFYYNDEKHSFIPILIFRELIK